MPELSDIYSEVILEHNRHPRNRGRVESPTHESHCDNPTCGDTIDLSLRVKDGRIEDVKFLGEGCAISQASASIMTQMIKGMSVEDAETLEAEFRRMLLEENYQPDAAMLGDLIALQGVKKLHARVKCAVCAWHALDAALSGAATVSTEEK
ncbi:MAG: SUF system NifU family Fe-S cluster assembly protein [Planctomycetales bacterium 4484_113]|nr:MAG: SUF system NifU family Fe-S cluster assembly protein [Planctomycetales bacterium 4484_113]